MTPAVVAAEDDVRPASPAPPRAVAGKMNRVGLFVLGDQIEDFLDPLGTTFGGSGGIVVPRESSQALAGAALRLIDDARLRERVGNRALRRIHEELSESTVGERLRSVVLDEAGRR